MSFCFLICILSFCRKFKPPTRPSNIQPTANNHNNNNSNSINQRQDCFPFDVYRQIDTENDELPPPYPGLPLNAITADFNHKKENLTLSGTLESNIHMPNSILINTVPSNDDDENITIL